MNRTARGFIIAGSAVVFVAAVLFGAWMWFTRSPFPKTSGTFRVEGTSGQIEILREDHGVPHIYATSAEDLFFGQGFVHAQDRFWQMEFWRRASSGRLSELFGKSTLETDKFLRTLGLRGLAEREFEKLAPETKKYLEAYSAGVNAYILHRRPARLGLEFALLRLQGVKFEIEPWTPVDSVAWGKMMAYDLGENHEAERLHVDILGAVGRKGWETFFSPYRKDMPVTVSDSELKKTLGAAAGRRQDPLAGPMGGDIGIGSNSWVVSGRRTATGKPILANDMHLGIQMPSIWYEIGMHGVRADGTFGRTASCPFDMHGFSFPGSPGVVAGHNDRIAWGHTNLGGDVQDFYVEKLNPENPDQYEVNGRWVDMGIRIETIKVRKADEPTIIRVRSTRHGPVLSDLALWSELGGFTVSTGKEFPDGVGLTAVALRWTALQPGHLLDSVIGLDRASDFEDFREALRSWDVPAQNVIYADVDGNIGYQVPGLHPIRARGHGLAPAPGWTDEFEWTGFIPFEKLPYLYNPEAGYIVTANAAVVGPAYPYYLGSQYVFGERARRIRELIESHHEGITLDDMAKIQGDVYDEHAADLVSCLRGLDLASGGDGASTAVRQETEKERAAREKKEKAELGRMNAARDRLLSWDFQMRRESPEAALYGFFWLALVQETFRDQYPEKRWPKGTGYMQNALYYLVRDTHNLWWDDVRTPDVREERDQILARAFRKGYRAAVARLGERYETWRWGKVHTALFRNATLGSSGISPIERIFNRGPIEASGGITTVAVSGWDLAKPFEVRHIASQRFIIDLADFSRSLIVHAPGQSGHPFQRHYDDFIRDWRDVRYHSTYWERGEVEAASREKLRLVK